MHGGAETHKQHSGHEPVERVQASSLPGEACPAWGPEVDLGHSHPCDLDPYKQSGTDQDQEFVYRSPIKSYVLLISPSGICLESVTNICCILS